MTTEEAETMLDQDLSEHIEASEILETEAPPNVMGYIQLSSPLLAQLDRIAIGEGKPREILIQRVLWEFVHEQGAEEPTPS